MTSSSIKLSLVGAQVDCSTNTSLPRTFSSNSTITSPSENLPTIARPSERFRCFATSCPRRGLALPVNTIRRSSGAEFIPAFPIHRAQALLAGEEGFEPSYGGIKIRCLNQLGDSPVDSFCFFAQRVSLQPPRYETLHPLG